MDKSMGLMTEAALSPVQESTRMRLERTKQHLEDRIKDIDRAVELLGKNPEMEELQDLLRRI
jgi:hypothetical protein